MQRTAGIWAVVLAAGLVPVGVAAQGRDAQNDAQQPTIQARPGGPESAPRTSQVPVSKGTRLVLTNNAGEAVVRRGTVTS
ncbi:MAG: hypothetical protein R2712_01930 [Vicinamibacterales bacterium]